MTTATARRIWWSDAPHACELCGIARGEIRASLVRTTDESEPFRSLRRCREVGACRQRRESQGHPWPLVDPRAPVGLTTASATTSRARRHGWPASSELSAAGIDTATARLPLAPASPSVGASGSLHASVPPVGPVSPAGRPVDGAPGRGAMVGRDAEPRNAQPDPSRHVPRFGDPRYRTTGTPRGDRGWEAER